MNVGIVSFYSNPEHIGGGHIPALALKDWCDIFLVDAEVICYTESVSMEYLNSFDRLFFVTPPIFHKIDMSKIRKPYMFMIHGEGDCLLYKDTINDILCNENLIDVVDIFDYDLDGLLTWYPCCRPNDLVKMEIEFSEGSGMLYASRISRWLNVDMFMEFADIFADSSYMIGPCSNPDTKLMVRKLSNESYKVNLVVGTFDKKDLPYKEHRYFWDAAGNERKAFFKKRISLSAHEALAKGLIPIVFDGQVPDYLADICLKIPRSCNLKSFDMMVDNYEASRQEKIDEFNDDMYHRPVHEVVNNQVERILRRLLWTKS